MKLPLGQISIFYAAIGYLLVVDAKGGSGGGGGGGGGGRGGGVSVSRGGGFARGGSKGLTKARAAVVLGGGGAAGYAAYRAHKNIKKERDKENEGPDFDTFDNYNDDPDYKLQEATSYYASEGIGMSAWTLLALILGIIALGTIGWYCCNVFLPVWEDNRKMRRRSMMRRNPGLKDEVPLQETPSTATPSP